MTTTIPFSGFDDTARILVFSGFRLPFQEYMLVLSGKTSAAHPLAHDAFAKLGDIWMNDAFSAASATVVTSTE